jgi:hypothetical protein
MPLLSRTNRVVIASSNLRLRRFSLTEIRSAVSNDLGCNAGDRRPTAIRNGTICRMLAERGFDTVCSEISLVPGHATIKLRKYPHCSEIFVRAFSSNEDGDPSCTCRFQAQDLASVRRGETYPAISADIADHAVDCRHDRHWSIRRARISPKVAKPTVSAKTSFLEKT